MTVQRQNLPSFASIVSVMSIMFYCAGFLRLELELNKHKDRIHALEDVTTPKPPSLDPNMVKSIKNVFGKFMVTFRIT